MRNFITEHLICVADNCDSLLDVECIRSVKDDCVEGFLRCNRCDASYPIINGVAILVNDLTNYMSQRTRVLGKWLLECKSDSMKRFLREKSKNMQNISQNRYEEGGAWFEPYLYMHSSKKKVDKHFAQIIDESFDNFYTHIVKLVLSRFASSKMCLDLGCATGIATHRLAKKLDHVFGVDQSYSFVKEARKQNKNGNAEFLVANSLKLPFKKRKFDLVTSFNMLDLVNPEDFISNVSSLLKPNGNLVLADPYDFRDEKGDPKNSYDSKSIRKLLTDKKFTVDKKTCKESFLPWVLRINKRAYLFYFTDLIMARKST